MIILYFEVLTIVIYSEVLYESFNFGHNTVEVFTQFLFVTPHTVLILIMPKLNENLDRNQVGSCGHVKSLSLYAQLPRTT
jgi:hypothetical protein